MDIKPISPDEIAEAKQGVIPGYVFAAVNDMIARCYSSGYARFTQDDLIEEIQSRTTVSRTTLFQKGYLNFEEAYRAQGWSVVYDKPGYNESYKANFTFKKKS